jgi:hypothetical protein
MKRKILAVLLLFVLMFSIVNMTSCDISALLGGMQGADGVDGADGKDGADGEDGKDGDDGKDGVDGIGVSTVVINEKNELVITLSNGTVINLGNVKGDKGEAGEDGVDGEDGKDGVDGKDGEDGITPLLRINEETNYWEVSYDNGKTWASLGYKVDADRNSGFDGLKISILGDSISTYVNASSGTASTITNSTINGGAVYYTAGKLGVYQGDTWWQQTADALGGSILVNNSWSGSCVFSTRSGTVGAYIDRCIQLHDNTGLNAGEEPDIIFVYLGTNDCSVLSTYPLGDYASINFSRLIQKTENGYIYEEPTTASEAYAIMIHKIRQRYKDAEVYCMIPCQRKDGGSSVIDARLKFYNAIEKIAERFGAYTVDLYNDSGITTDNASFSTFIPDGSLHPGCEGMDAITNTVISSLYQNSKYAPKDKKVYSVSYETDSVILEGRKYAVLEDEPFTCTIKEKSGHTLSISVFMNGEDLTDSVCAKNTISIDRVKGNLIIVSTYERIPRDPLSFRFETIDDKLVSVTTDGNTENILTQIKGSISNGYYSSGHFSIDTEIELLHDRSWAIEWKIKGSPNILLLSGTSTSSGNTNGGSYLYMTTATPIITLGEYTNSQYYNYVCRYDKSYLSNYHVYRLENKVDEQGNNMVYLFIDGQEIGELNNVYIGTSNQGKTSDWVCGRDLFFSYIGTSDAHPISNCYIEYIQIWESLE